MLLSHSLTDNTCTISGQLVLRLKLVCRCEIKYEQLTLDCGSTDGPETSPRGSTSFL